MRNKGTQIPRLCALLTLCALLLGLLPQTAGAANVRFITDIRLAAGESGPDSLEAEGYSVMSLGLNAGAAGDEQVWLGFKLGEEAPVTNVLVIADAGEAYESPDGLRYVRAGAVDVEQGRGSAGCVYYTTDERAGAPLVGLDILRADEGEGLLASPNDGSEVVRYPDGAPAELEPGSETVSMYLAQIRDGLVKPYISELTTVTEADRRSAVYTAAAWGYDYFIDGDVDGSRETYTIIAYKRTADPAQAITNLAAVAAEDLAVVTVCESFQVDVHRIDHGPQFLQDRRFGGPIGDNDILQSLCFRKSGGIPHELIPDERLVVSERDADIPSIPRF